MKQIINYLKKNKTAMAFAIVFGLMIIVTMIASFLGIDLSTNNNNHQTNITNIQEIGLKSSQVSDNKANLTVSNNKEQRNLLLENEHSVRNYKINNDNETYIRKQLMDGKDFKDSKYIKTDKLSVNINDDNTTENINKEEIELSDIIKKDSNNTKNIEILLKKRKKEIENTVKAIEQIKTSPDISLLENELENETLNSKKQKNNMLKPNNKNINKINSKVIKYQKLLAIANSRPDSIGGISLDNGLVYNHYLNSHDITENREDNNVTEPKLEIYPGSTYIGKLLTPLNSLYAGNIKPVIDFYTGDLKGYRGVGNIIFNEASDGVLIAINKLVESDGTTHNVNGYAISYDGKYMSPTFADELDRHLIGKIGYSVLSVLSDDVSNMYSTNASKDTNTIEAGDTTKQITADTLGTTFADIASQYRTEVKVYPKTVLVIFY